MTIELTAAQRSELRRAIGRLDGTSDLTPALTELYLKLALGPEPPAQQYQAYVKAKLEQAERMKEPCDCRKTEPAGRAALPEHPAIKTWTDMRREFTFLQNKCEVNTNAWWYYEGMKITAILADAEANKTT